MELNKKINQEKREKEHSIDVHSLDLAKRNLEAEIKRRAEEKKNMQEELINSWEQTKMTKKLTEDIDRLRRFGDYCGFEDISEDLIENTEEDEEEKKIQDQLEQDKHL